MTCSGFYQKPSGNKRFLTKYTNKCPIFNQFKIYSTEGMSNTISSLVIQEGFVDLQGQFL